MLERVLQRLDAGGVRRAGRLAEDGLLAVLLEPRRREVEALAADGAADAGLGGSGAIFVFGELVLVGTGGRGGLTEVLVEFLNGQLAAA